MEYINRMNIGRVLTILGFAIGLRSVMFTWGHIGSDMFLLTPETRLAQTHGWHHFFREVFGDFGAMIGVCILLWAPVRYRGAGGLVDHAGAAAGILCAVLGRHTLHGRTRRAEPER